MNNQNKIIIALVVLIVLILGIVFYFYVLPDIVNKYRIQGVENLMIQQLNEMRCYISNGTDVRIVPLSSE